MKRVTLTYRKYVNHLEQEGRVVVAYHAEPLDERGTVQREVVECDQADVEEFCVRLRWINATGEPKTTTFPDGIEAVVQPRTQRERNIPLDTLWNIEIEEVTK